jgi:hypothetical protein
MSTRPRPWNEPYFWDGPPGAAPSPLSLLDLIAARNLDEHVAAILWALVHRRSSIIVASMPQRAGKTATLTALLDLLPERYERVYLRGVREPFAFAGQTDPKGAILLVNEVSDHLPYYLWDEQAQRALGMLREGYALAATMHADSPEQVMSELSTGLGLGADVLGLITAVVNLEVRRNPKDPWGEPLRRVSAITLVEMEGRGLAFSRLTHWDEKHDVMVRRPEGVRFLAGRLGVDGEMMDRELLARTHHLLKLRMAGGPTDRAAFRAAAAEYTGPGRS